LSPHGMIVTFRGCRIPFLNLKPNAGGLHFLLETPTKANHCRRDAEGNPGSLAFILQITVWADKKMTDNGRKPALI